jgi:hypothetical protein
MSIEGWQALRRRVLEDADLQAILWRHADWGAFEAALAALGAPEAPCPWIRAPISDHAVLNSRPAGPHWAPADLDLMTGRGVQWIYCGGERPVEPFFSMDTWRWSQRPLNAFLQAHASFVPDPDPPPPVVGLVFHLSRCGSTLVGQMLRAACPDLLVLLESRAIGKAARHLPWAPIDAGRRVEQLRYMAKTLYEGCGAPPGGLVIKAEGTALYDLDVYLQAFPGTPWIVIHRDPAEILASHQREPAPEATQGVLEYAPPPSLDFQMSSTLSPESYAAHVLAALCEAATEGLEKPGSLGRLVGYADIVAWTMQALPCHFALSLPSDAEARMSAMADRDAKFPQTAFIDDSREKRRLADTAEIACAARIVQPAYQALLGAGA